VAEPTWFIRQDKSLLDSGVESPFVAECARCGWQEPAEGVEDAMTRVLVHDLWRHASEASSSPLAVDRPDLLHEAECRLRLKPPDSGLWARVRRWFAGAT
jgi:hypothetical protein